MQIIKLIILIIDILVIFVGTINLILSCIDK